MNHDDDQSTIWSLSYSQLAEQCRLIAKDNSAAINETLKAEAGRLHAAWQAALLEPAGDYDEHARVAALRAGLRKRTIEILVRFGLEE